MKRIVLLVLTALLFLAPLAAQSSSTGEQSYNLYSPLMIGKGLDITALDTPQQVGVNPAAAAFFQRYILDMNYINTADWQAGGSPMGTIANLALSAPNRYGVITTALHYQDWSAFGGTSYDWGRFLTADVAYSKELYDDLYIGISLKGTYGTSAGGDWGAGLSAGVIYLPGSLWNLENVRIAASLNNLGKSYGTEAASIWEGIPENITPMAGLSFDAWQKDQSSLRLYGTLSFPSVTDVKLDLGGSLHLNETLSVYSSLSADTVDILNGYYQSLIPSLAININLPLTPRSEIGNRLQTSELNVQAGGAMLYDNIIATGAGVTMPFGVRDNTPPELTLDYPEEQYISPNYDGTQDELLLPFAVDDDRYIKGYTLTIRDSDGNTVREFHNKDARPENSTVGSLWERVQTPRQSIPVPESFRWDGLTEEGEMAADGDYSYTVEFWDDNDNMFTSEPMAFHIDATTPEIDLEKPLGADLIFSPDGDGNKDSFELPQSGSSEDQWVAEIKNAAGEVVKSFNWDEAMPEAVLWDGTDDEGEVLPDGVYHYVISTTDRAGNTAEESLSNILINTTQPEIRLAIDRAHFAPGNAQAVDRIGMTMELSTLNGLTSWDMAIVDSSDRELKTWDYRSNEALLLAGEMEYRGETDRSGFLEEGQYRLRFQGRYQNGFTPLVYSPEFTVDNTAPTIDLSLSPRIFSPDGDGRQDEVLIQQTSSEETSWRGVILNEQDEVVREYIWRGLAQEELSWNGQDQDGQIRSVDGPKDYSYYLEATDQAGNYTRSAEMDFVYDNSQVEFLLSVDHSAFSPNGDGVKDRLTISMNRTGTAAISEYRLFLTDLNQREIMEISNGSEPPATLAWNGQSVEDGEYMVGIELTYRRGDQISVTSPSFVMDRIFPEITLATSPLLFSPNGDNRRDSFVITQNSSVEELFEAQLLDRQGNEVASWFWQGQLESLNWAGTDQSGNIVPDGRYSYVVRSQDAAGNRTEERVDNIEVDNRNTQVFLTAQREIFSPSGLEEVRLQTFQIMTSLEDGVDRWELELIHAEQGLQKRWAGQGLPPQEIIWDGQSDRNQIVEGEYSAIARVYYEKGDRPEAETLPFILDNSAPDISLRLEPLPFSPDDDNVDDELILSMAVRDQSPIQGWSMTITDPRGREFISFSGQGRPTQRIIWDGRSNRGELVQSAEDYSYSLAITDTMGNQTIEEGLIPVDILVVRDGDRLKILISNITFEPERPTLTDDPKNMEVLQRIAEILEKYSRYRVVVEGHANPFDGTQAERTVLATLSEQRAERVMDILIELGVSADRLGFIGRGGDAILADPRDSEENWQNRRVEFILEK